MAAISNRPPCRGSTTDPEALAKAVGIKEKKEAHTTSGSTQDDWAERRQRREAAEEQITQAVELAAQAFAKVYPDHAVQLANLADIFEKRDIADFMPEKIVAPIENAAKGVRPSLPALKAYLACVLISEAVDFGFNDKTALKAAQKPITDLAHEMRVKLPAGWDAPLYPPKVEKAEAKATAKPVAKSKTKKAK